MQGIRTSTISFEVVIPICIDLKPSCAIIDMKLSIINVLMNGDFDSEISCVIEGSA